MLKSIHEAIVAKSLVSFGIFFIAFEPGVGVDWQGDLSFQDTMSALKCGEHTRNTIDRKSLNFVIACSRHFCCIIGKPFATLCSAGLRDAKFCTPVSHWGGASLPEWLRWWT